MKVKDCIKMIEDDGWYLVVTRGSHRQYKHPVRPGRVTIFPDIRQMFFHREQ